jgi:hypothetical protein
VQFFCWAEEQRGWQALKEGPIPKTNRLSVSVDAVLEFADPDIPDDLSRDELGEQLKYCLKDIRQLRRDRAELAEIRRKKAESGLAYSITTTPDGVPLRVWDSEPVTMTVDEAPTDDGHPEQDAAVKWLRDVLAPTSLGIYAYSIPTLTTLSRHARYQMLRFSS